MKPFVTALSLMIFAVFAGHSWAAECYEGTWVAETKTASQSLEITADGCLKLKVIPKGDNPKEVFYNTCYKIKKSKKNSYVFEIKQDDKFSSAEVTCTGNQVQLKWGKISNQLFHPVKD